LVLAHLPLLIWHGQVLWERPHYQFFPLLVPGAAFLAWQRLRHLGPLTAGSVWPSRALLIAGAGLLTTAALLGSPWLGIIAALLNILAVAFTLGGLTLLRALLPAWLFLCLAVPPPLGLDQRLIDDLQSGTARACSRILDVFGVYHVRAGNTIEANGQQLLVDEACAGAQPFYALLACALFFILWTRSGWLHGLLLVAFGLGWALASNLLRVLALVVLTVRWHWDVSGGWRHEAIGILSFVVCLLLVWSTYNLLVFLTPRSWRAAPTGPADDRGPTRLADWRLTALGGWAVPLAFGVLAVVQLPALAALLAPGPAPLAADQLTDLGEDTLPARHGTWERTGFETEERDSHDALGRFSHRWAYRRPGLRAVVSLDYPFARWHELPACYERVGWHRAEQVVERGEGDNSSAFVLARFDKARGRQGYLWFGLCDRHGQALVPFIEQPKSSVLQDRFGGRLLGLRQGPTASAAPAPPPSDAPCYQIQLFVQSPRRMTVDEGKQAEALFQHARTLLSAPRAQEGK
jgi:exosortase